MTSEIVIAVVWGITVAAIGAFLTELSPWYYALRRPTWQPPDWLFGPAWTVILGLASLAMFLGLRNSQDRRDWLLVLAVFLLNGVLNIVWSPLFFKLRRPDWALMEVPFLWLSILLPIVILWLISRTGSYLMVPYLVWVSFAAVLNIAIVRMNRPFTG
jgi:translocator protein